MLPIKVGTLWESLKEADQVVDWKPFVFRKDSHRDRSRSREPKDRDKQRDKDRERDKEKKDKKRDKKDKEEKKKDSKVSLLLFSQNFLNPHFSYSQ